MSHDPTTAGFDALSPPPREGEPTVKWPILAQLPWVGEPLAGDPLNSHVIHSNPSEEGVYPFPRTSEPPINPTPFRLVEPESDCVAGAEETLDPVDRRLHPGPVGRAATEAPHLNLHRFTPAEPLRPAVEEPQYRTPPASMSPARQYRRVDPPQHRTTAAFSLHTPSESLASRIYQWHAAAKPQVGMAVLAGLVLAAGGLYWAMVGSSRSQPAANPLESPPWSVELTPRASTALPVAPPLDLAPQTNSSAPRPGGPATGEHPAAAGVPGDDDPIALWLNRQPIVTPRTEAPTASAKPAEAEPLATVEPQLTAPQLPAAAPLVPVNAVTPTPITPTSTTPSLSLAQAYPTTPFPAFNFSLCEPSTQVNAPSVAETLGTPFDQSSTPR